MSLEQVAELVTRWRRARGSMERVRVIAAGARTLGGLTPDDRRALANALAEHGAPQVAARLEPRTGGALSPAELTDLARAVLSVDQATLDGLAAALDDPDERRRLLREGAGHVEALLDDEAPSGRAVPLPPPPGAPRADAPARTTPAPVPLQEAPELTSPSLGAADLGAADLGAAGLGTAGLGTADVARVDLHRPDAATVDLADAVHHGGGPAAGRAPPAPPPPVTHDRESWRGRRPPAPPDDPAPAPDPPAEPTASAPEPATAPRHHAEVPDARRPPDLPVTVARVRSAATARERLATVAALEHHHLATDELLQVLDAVPDGWQRRTAARRLVVAGVATEVDADALVRRLGRAADRVAVAASLVDVGAADVSAVADAIGPRAADRLRRRASAG